MKPSSLSKILVAILLMSCLAPSVSAKKETIKVNATAIGTADGVPIIVNLDAKIAPTSELTYSGPAQISMSFVLPDGTKITARTSSEYYATVSSTTPKQIVAMWIDVNEQTIPLSYNEEANLWVTVDTPLTLRNGETVTLNLVWALNLNTPSGTVSANTAGTRLDLTAKGTATLGEKEVPIFVNLITIISSNDEGGYEGPAFLRMQIVGSEKQGEVLKGNFFISGDPRHPIILSVNGQEIPITYDGDAEKWVTKTSITLGNGIEVYLSLAWAPKGIAQVGLG